MSTCAELKEQPEPILTSMSIIFFIIIFVLSVIITFYINIYLVSIESILE